MKKLLIVAAASLLLFGGQAGAEAAPADLSASVQTQEMSAWPRIRDELLGRDHHRHHRHHDYRDHHRDHHHSYRDDHHRRPGYGPPPPPPRR